MACPATLLRALTLWRAKTTGWNSDGERRLKLHEKLEFFGGEIYCWAMLLATEWGMRFEQWWAISNVDMNNRFKNVIFPFIYWSFISCNCLLTAKAVLKCISRKNKQQRAAILFWNALWIQALASQSRAAYLGSGSLLSMQSYSLSCTKAMLILDQHSYSEMLCGYGPRSASITSISPQGD